MSNGKYKGFILMLVLIVAMGGCIVFDEIDVTASSGWVWANNKSPLGTEGDTLYLKDKVQVAYAVGGNTTIHYIQGTASLVKNRVDPYCYVRISGVWYVHLAGVRTDNGYSTTGWYKESDVITSAGLDEVSGYVVYGNEGAITSGGTLEGDTTSSTYYANSSGWITHSTKGLKYHNVTSGDTLGSSGLYDPNTFGLSRKGYEVTAWVNVDVNGKIYGTYNFTSNYNVDNFVTSSGEILKNSVEGSYIYLVPVWAYTNEAPVITSTDIHMYATSDWNENRLLEDVSVWDKEEGDLTGSLMIMNSQELQQALKDFAAEEVGDIREMELLVEVEDSLGEVSKQIIKVIAYGIEGITCDYGYVRYISPEYTDTFSSTSVWNELSRKSFLLGILTG